MKPPKLLKKINIIKSPVADTRTCDFTKVTKEQLLDASKLHINDVRKGLKYLSERLLVAGESHDYTKLKNIDQFHNDFKTGFKSKSWYTKHKQLERHHLSEKDGIRKDVDLIDVIEFLTDCVMAGLARSGKYRQEKLPKGLLEKAFNNTVKELISIIEVS